MWGGGFFFSYFFCFVYIFGRGGRGRRCEIFTKLGEMKGKKTRERRNKLCRGIFWVLKGKGGGNGKDGGIKTFEIEMFEWMGNER